MHADYFEIEFNANLLTGTVVPLGIFFLIKKS